VVKEYKEIPIKNIAINGQIRKDMDPAGIKDLTASIKSVGILEPLIIRRSEGELLKKGAFTLIAGHRRLKAAGGAGLKEVPCIVLGVTEQQALEIQVIENLQRRDLNPIDEATGYKVLMEMCEYDLKGVASKIGISESSVRKRIRLLELPKKYQDAILTDKITPGHGLVLVRLQDPEKQAELYDEIIDDEYSVKRAEEVLENYTSNLSKAPFCKKDCEKCPHNGQQQLDMFDKKNDLKGECLYSKCFNQKFDEWLKVKRAALEKQGFRVITEKELEKRGWANREQLHSFQKKELGPDYKGKCRKNCEHYVYALQRNVYDPIREFCFNAKCLNKLTRDTTDPGTGDGNKQSSADYVNIRRDDKQDFYIEVALKKTDNKIIQRLILLDLILPNTWQPDEAEEFLSRHCELTSKEKDKRNTPDLRPVAMERLLAMPDKVIAAGITEFMMKGLRDRQNNLLDVMARHQDVDIEQDFLITEKYLKKKTKAQIMKIAEEIKLLKYLKKIKHVLVRAGNKMPNLPKPKMIAVFFKEGFDLKGKVPKEIIKHK
jgi:ParB/RepB/Spo0J family partition protein